MTPASSGAIAVIQVEGAAPGPLESALGRAGVPVPTVGALRVGSIAGVDEGVVVRWSSSLAHLMPHAGPAVVAEVVRRLVSAGARLEAGDEADARAIYPEASDEIEAQALLWLTRAASPAAVDLLLDQARRWHELGATSDPGRDRVLNRLIEPPLVVAFGAPNVGKSTLCNALAGTSVSIVADEAGTTRDHVGVMVELCGVVVRYVDTPGMVCGERGNLARAGASPEERDAVDIALTVVRAADLVVRCGDAASGLIGLPEGVNPAAGVVDVALRADLGGAGFSRAVDVVATTGVGVGELGELIRDRLVPRWAVEDRGPWKFWT